MRGLRKLHISGELLLDMFKVGVHSAYEVTKNEVPADAIFEGVVLEDSVSSDSLITVLVSSESWDLISPIPYFSPSCMRSS